MLQIKYVENGDKVNIVKIDLSSTKDKLTPNVYVVKFDREIGFYLEVSNSKLEIPEKLYGDVLDKYKKVEKMYESSDKGLGVLLTGLKGSSKTTLLTVIAKNMLNKNKPVIIVSEPFAGSDFMEFIDSLGEVVILFDEFGKVYKDKKDQHKILTLFDGIYKSKRLSIMTDNSVNVISSLFINRPSRMALHWNYNRLDIKLIENYIEDNLNNKDYKEDILNIYKYVKDFNFDILQHIVHSCNIFDGEEFKYIMDGLNVKTTLSNIEFKDISLYNKREKEYVDVKDIEISNVSDGFMYNEGTCYKIKLDQDSSFVDNILICDDSFVSNDNGLKTYETDVYVIKFREVIKD